ncbi:MAG: exosortase/archaeosortase family protein [Verrucomicrobiota bacterium]
MEPALPPSPNTASVLSRRGKRFLLFAAALVACFGIPLLALLRFSLHSELYSHVMLIPAISGYLIWTDRRKINTAFESARLPAIFCFAIGISLLLFQTLFLAHQPAVDEADRLCVWTLAFLAMLVGGLSWIHGQKVARSVAFPLAFLVFMVPMPRVMEDGLVTFLQHASAETSYRMLTWSGMSVFREGTQFTLPHVSFGVAPECSGIRSTLVLFMTGLLAAYFFLKQKRSQLVLVLMLIPLGILRNSIRIFTLAWLAVKWNPDVLNSDLHHRGGPFFFAVSLLPFFLLIWLLRKLEARQFPK